MKFIIASICFVLSIVDASTRIPPSLSKAALEATKRTAKLRKLEKKRVQALTDLVAEEGRIADTSSKESIRSDHVRSGRKSRGLIQHDASEAIEETEVNEVQRKLEDNGNNNNGNYYNGQNVVADANAWEYNYNWNYNGAYGLEELNNNDFGFDMRSMSFHYTGCSAIKSWSDEMAEDANIDTVLMAQRMATFRLCPTSSCSSNTYNGCSSNYGDYVVSMDQFLLGMLALQEDRVLGYCQYCQECSDIEAFKSFYSELEYRRQYLLSMSERSYASWVTNYKATYGADDEENNDEYYERLYYKKLTSGNYANNYVYGNGYANYQNNKYNGNGYQYNNQQQQYANYGYNGYNGYNANNQNRYYYQYNNNDNNNNNNNNNNYNYNNNYNNYNNYNNNGNYYGQVDDGTVRANAYQAKNQEKWQMWNSYNMNSYGYATNGENEADYQLYNYNLYSQMKTWSSMAAWFGNRVVNGHYTYNNYNQATWQSGWGYIGNDGEFYSLDYLNETVKGTDFGYDIPQNWLQYMESMVDGDIDAIESCTYENAGSCYNQFFACMQVLGEDMYEEYVEKFNEELYGEMYKDVERERFMASMTDYLECTKIEFDVDWNGNGNQQQNANANDAYQAGYTNGQWYAYDGMNYQGQWESYRNQNSGELEFYIGPHCDGEKITLGVYTDQYCSKYANSISIEDLLGFNPIDDEGSDFDMVPTECVSCLYDDTMDKWYDEEQVDGVANGVEPMCSILYQFSGKCQKNLKTSTSSNNNGNTQMMYQSKNQYINEDLVCAYIESLRLNTYNEQGDVILPQSVTWKPSEWKNIVDVNKKSMSGAYKAGIVMSSLAMASMAVAAVVLHSMLARKNIPWRSKRPASSGDQTALARQNSGILLGRSRSDPKNAPLI